MENEGTPIFQTRFFIFPIPVTHHLCICCVPFVINVRACFFGGLTRAQAAMSAKELKAAMATFEDADDVEAGRALEREAADEQMEFDDNGGPSTKVFRV